MRVLDRLGRRWALRVLWELRHGPLTFRALREACDDVSPSSLNQRLRELRALGVIGPGDAGYGLTRSGTALSRIVIDLHRWAEQMLGKPRSRASPGPRTARPAAPAAARQAASRLTRITSAVTRPRPPGLPESRRQRQRGAGPGAPRQPRAA